MNGCVVSIPMDSDFQINGSLLIDMMTCKKTFFVVAEEDHLDKFFNKYLYKQTENKRME